MTDASKFSKTFSDLPREDVALLAKAQRRLLSRRRRYGIPLDRRSEKNLKRIERELAGVK